MLEEPSEVREDSGTPLVRKASCSLVRSASHLPQGTMPPRSRCGIGPVGGGWSAPLRPSGGDARALVLAPPRGNVLDSGADTFGMKSSCLETHALP